MSNKPISLTNKTQIFGLSNIVVSEVENTIYINSKLQVDDGTKGAIAFYLDDGQKISSKGVELFYDEHTKFLYVPNLYISSRLNIERATIDSSLGAPGDAMGDIALDENYLYYCIKYYDGESKIWKRTKLEDW
jgi:hypothetical protein